MAIPEGKGNITIWHDATNQVPIEYKVEPEFIDADGYWWSWKYIPIFEEAEKEVKVD